MFSGNWRPIFGYNHSNKMKLGNVHGNSWFYLNLGPKPRKGKNSDPMKILMQDNGDVRRLPNSRRYKNYE